MPIETPNLNSGDVIPEGYFGMLYRDLKSLLLRGDEKYLFVDNTPTGQVIRFRPQAEQRGGGVSGGGNAGYNGYFKISDAGENKITVADGATGGASTCKVNNKVFSVPAWTSEAITASKIVALKYTAASGDAAASVAVELFDELPDDSDADAYCQIGRVIVSGETSTIQQDHTTGVAQIWWYLLCQEATQ
ncbi:hypothetical protein [Victivallis vadensis]|uniref:hypothetical protein n=1 Tax=Victivallis vadensis TaxID=172901 RepID=UPI003AF74652